MSVEYRLGYIVGIAVAIAITAVLVVLIGKFANKNGRIKTEYDERQNIVRGKGYMIGFWTLVIYICLIGVSYDLGLNIPAGMGIMCFIGMIIAITVHCSYCIWNGAYWGLNNNIKRFMIVIVIGGAINWFIAILSIIEGRMLVDGMVKGSFINLMVGVMLLVILIVIALRKMADKKEEE